MECGAKGLSSNRTESKTQVKSIKSMSKVIFAGLTQQRGAVISKIEQGTPEAFPTGLIRTHNGVLGWDSNGLLNGNVLS